MALIDVNGLRDRFDIDDAESYPDERIELHIFSAARRLRGWVGDATYAQAGLDAEDEDYDAELAAILKNAEAHLTMHYAIVGFQYPLHANGILSTSMADEGREIRKYLSPDQTAAVARQFLEAAESMASPYMTSSTDPMPEVVFSSVDDLSCEGVTRPCP